MLRGCAETGVGLGSILAHNRYELIFVAEFFCGFKDFFISAVGAAQGQPQPFLHFNAHSFISLIIEYMVSRMSSAAV